MHRRVKLLIKIEFDKTYQFSRFATYVILLPPAKPGGCSYKFSSNIKNILTNPYFVETLLAIHISVLNVKYIIVTVSTIVQMKQGTSNV